MAKMDVAILKELDIKHDDMMDNPAEFAKRLRDAASKLDNELKQKNSVLSMEERFRSKASANKEANEVAEEFCARIIDEIMGFDPETMACILVRMPNISHEIASTIRALSMRENGQVSKRRTHLMYNRLRKVYEVYVGFMKSFKTTEIGNPPPIPSRPGNYGSDSYSVTEYEFFINGEGFFNWYYVARILGIEIDNYMDLVDAIKNSGGTINGHSVSMSIATGDDE